MRTRRLRAALLAVVALALAGIGYKVWSSVEARRGGALEKMAAELLPHVAQHMRNFRRVKVQDGRTVWEITAAEAQYLEDQQQVVVNGPHVTFYMKDDDRPVRLQSASGRIHLSDGRELVSLELEGDVVVWLDDIELRTESASYVRATDRITAPGAVTIRGRRLDLKARGMEVDVEPRSMRLLADVHSVLAPRSDES